MNLSSVFLIKKNFLDSEKKKERERERIESIISSLDSSFSVEKMFFGWKRMHGIPTFFEGKSWRVDFSHLASFAIFHHGPRKNVWKRNRSTVSIVFPNVSKRGANQRFILPFLPFSKSFPPPIHIYRRVKVYISLRLREQARRRILNACQTE